MKEKQCKNCSGKKTVRTKEEKKIVTDRLNRIEGQIKGIKRMIEEDRYCDDILIQLSAIDKAKYNILVNVMGVNNAGLLASILTFVSALKKV